MQMKFRTEKKDLIEKPEVKYCITAFTDMKFYSTMHKIVNEEKVQKRQMAHMLVYMRFTKTKPSSAPPTPN